MCICASPRRGGGVRLALRHHELELPDTAAGGDPQPLHLRGQAVAHRAHRVPHRADRCRRRVHLLRRAGTSALSTMAVVPAGTQLNDMNPNGSICFLLVHSQS